jgi:hypothetical protein
LYSLVVLCETNVLNLISQRLDTIYQIKPKHAIILFLHLFAELNTPAWELNRAVAAQPSDNVGTRWNKISLLAVSVWFIRARKNPLFLLRSQIQILRWISLIQACSSRSCRSWCRSRRRRHRRACRRDRGRTGGGRQPQIGPVVARPVRDNRRWRCRW